MKDYNTSLRILSIALFMLGLSCSEKTKTASADQIAVENIDLNRIKNESDYASLIINYLESGLTDNKEEQII